MTAGRSGFTEHADHQWADVIRLKQLVVHEDLPLSARLDDTSRRPHRDFATDISVLLEFVCSGAEGAGDHPAPRRGDRRRAG